MHSRVNHAFTLKKHLQAWQKICSQFLRPRKIPVLPHLLWVYVDTSICTVLQIVGVNSNQIEWLYLVRCNKFIELCSAMSGLPSGRKIVCAVVVLLRYHFCLWNNTIFVLLSAIRSFHIPQNTPPAAVLRSPCLPPRRCLLLFYCPCDCVMTWIHAEDSNDIDNNYIFKISTRNCPTTFSNALESMLHHLPQTRNTVFDRQWKSAYGATPEVCCVLWNKIDPNKTMPTGVNPKNLLWVLHFLKAYHTEHKSLQFLGKVDKKTYRKWFELFVDAISYLECEVARYFFSIQSDSLFSTEIANSPQI